jgi:glycosyltransferase involved in cell wall biosynthesis
MPETQRIAFVSSLGLGGATTFLCNLGGELARRKIPVLVVSPEIENPMASDFEAAGVPVILQNQRRMIFEDRLEAMLRDLAEFRPTAVVACLGPASYEVLRYVPPGVRRVAVIQADHPMFYDAVMPYAGCMDDVGGVSATITGRLEKMAAFRTVTKYYLPHGVAMPQPFHPRPPGDQPLRILYHGRLTNPQKRVRLFPEILAGLQKADIPFQWTIAGDGDERDNLKQLMPSARADQQVVFPGALPNAQVPALLANHDVFLLASNAEGLPVSLLEAMAQGVVPVVSNLESGIRDVVDETNGILVDVDDTAGYARAIIHLHQNRDELAAKSAAAHARVQKEFSVAAMTDRWLAVLPPMKSAMEPWPRRWRITAPLTANNPRRFSWPMRVLRRMAARMRRKE